jgi:type IV pilus assembly protein PilN
MRVQINLATRPYVELDRILQQLRIALGVLAVLALGLGIWLHSVKARAHQQQVQLDRLNGQADAFTRERAANEAHLRQPVNASTLSRNQFLNTVFARKSFSWTAVLMDLEEVLPPGVQVSSIEPVLAASGDVTIRMRVLGDRERTVELVRNLEHSKRFLSPQLAGESQQTAERTGRTTIGANGLPQLTAGPATANGLPPITGVEFEIVSGYNPLQPRVHEKPETKKTPAADAASATTPKHVAKPAHTAVPAASKAPVQKGAAR